MLSEATSCFVALTCSSIWPRKSGAFWSFAAQRKPNHITVIHKVECWSQEASVPDDNTWQEVLRINSVWWYKCSRAVKPEMLWVLTSLMRISPAIIVEYYCQTDFKTSLGADWRDCPLAHVIFRVIKRLTCLFHNDKSAQLWCIQFPIVCNHVSQMVSYNDSWIYNVNVYWCISWAPARVVIFTLKFITNVCRKKPYLGYL